MDLQSIALLVLVVPHVIGGVFLGWWILPVSARQELRGWFREDDGGIDPARRPPAPGGGGAGSSLPLPDAVPAVARMRQPGRLGDAVPPPARRPLHPVDPERRRERQPH